MGGYNKNTSSGTMSITIGTCNVTSSGDLTIGGGGGDYYQGGIMGGENYNFSTGTISISITTCNVTSSGNLTIGGGGGYYQGGIMGGDNNNFSTGTMSISITTCNVSFCNNLNTFSYQGSNIEMPSPPSGTESRLTITDSNKQYVVSTGNTLPITVISVFIINTCYIAPPDTDPVIIGISPVLTPTVNGGNERSVNRELVRRTAPRIGLLRTFTSYNQEQKPKTKISTQADRIAYLKLKAYTKMYNNTKI